MLNKQEIVEIIADFQGHANDLNENEEERNKYRIMIQTLKMVID